MDSSVDPLSFSLFTTPISNVPSSTKSLNHNDIGRITGIDKDGVVQYLGVQYATLRSRFAPAVLRTYGGDDSIDATKIGPAVLAIPGGPEAEQSLIGHLLAPTEDVLTASDTEGLNLNITVPLPDDGEVRTKEKLPVFVFIHGGGFIVGSATWPQYDFTRFVRLSKEKGKPVIAIGFNYRVGAPGLMTSVEMRSMGCDANNALKDQHCALRWVREHISGFGGDPDNVTCAGQSAGAVSVSYHMSMTLGGPCFKRCILMSGSSLQMSPVPGEVAEQNYERAIKMLDLESASKEERMGSLNQMSDFQLRINLLGVPMLPVAVEDVDSYWQLRHQTFEEWRKGRVEILSSVDSVMIGDCAFDGNIQALRALRLKNGVARSFCEHVGSSSLPKDVGEKLLKSYDIHPDLDDDTAFSRVLEIANDIGFYAPTAAYAEGLSNEANATRPQHVYVYRFNEPNPWDGQWKGQTNHILDVAFLFQNFNDFLSEEQRRTAEAFANDVFAFCHGKAVWEEYKADRRVAKVMGPNGKAEVAPDVPEKVGRRKTVFELAEAMGDEGLDWLSEMFNAFLRGPPPPAVN